ncbi:hypothetical protein BT93_L5250 [Corymbia citriodora subsp. variegata]|uniref:6-methylsalicylate decarboxylase n=1 Tax=Corymbia citriodora subsp. variegata TaxID=360336 RepID=A0A8T0CG78_CORYI|nr:hypothetical protein BT93_L5250 [Corymbia citriodora subsp. variegata]
MRTSSSSSWRARNLTLPSFHCPDEAGPPATIARAESVLISVSTYKLTSQSSDKLVLTLPQKWSEEAHLEMMDKCNIQKAILSVSSPGTHLQKNEDASAVELTRYCNDCAANMKRTSPDRFGFWASLPLPDVEASLKEISRASDELNPDGFALLTNHHGIYLGQPEFDPVFAELNRRHATVFIHPTMPCHSHGGSAAPMTQYPAPMFEFFFDTARCLLNLLLSGTVARCPNITFIIPHCGGAAPPLLRRCASLGPMLNIPTVDKNVTYDWVRERLNSQFYFDSAGFSFPEQIHGLMQHISAERMLYGSDFPFTPTPAVAALAKAHDEHVPGIFGEEGQRALYAENAKRLLEKKTI